MLGLVPFAMAFAGFLVLRLGTFRILSIDPDSAAAYVIYNHRETDERIFEALVDSVSAKIWAYSLHDHPIVASLRLATENYRDRLFIHPPFFVYSSAILRRLFKLPLPGYALLCQLLTLSLLPVLVYSVSGQMASDKPLSRFQQMTSGTALWAIAIFSSCPIAAFCSQKIWIDNALMFASALTVVAHTILVITHTKHTAHLNTRCTTSHTTLQRSSSHDMHDPPLLVYVSIIIRWAFLGPCLRSA